MIRELRYQLLRRKHPQRYDFISMGLGIEARAKRCAKFWRRHLELSKAFQKSSLASIAEPHPTVAILGAGRLFDVPYEALESTKRVTLIDADPGVERAWKGLAGQLQERTQLQSHILDLTGCIDTWSNELERTLHQHRAGDLAALRVALDTLAPPDEISIPSAPFDCVVSLNLLSQIPLYWRDRAEDLISSQWGLDTDDQGEFSDPLRGALHRSMHRLQHQHLEQLRRCNAQRIVIISDRSFLYYEKDHATWEEHPALPPDLQPDCIPNYEVMRHESWFWHIAPQGIEYDDHGEIHDVHAWELRSLTTPTHEKNR